MTADSKIIAEKAPSALVEALAQRATLPTEILAIWRDSIRGLPERFEGRRPTALEIAVELQALAWRLAAGNDQIAANALALATIDTRAGVESVAFVTNTLVGQD